jgi:hypothetical protein
MLYVKLYYFWPSNGRNFTEFLNFRKKEFFEGRAGCVCIFLDTAY